MRPWMQKRNDLNKLLTHFESRAAIPAIMSAVERGVISWQEDRSCPRKMKPLRLSFLRTNSRNSLQVIDSTAKPLTKWRSAKVFAATAHGLRRFLQAQLPERAQRLGLASHVHHPRSYRHVPT